MLQIQIQATRLYNETTDKYTHVPAQTLKLEHSLLSVRKWESKWHKSYMNSASKLTTEENLDYVRCMCVNQASSPDAFRCLTKRDLNAIRAYIDEPMTAVKFRSDDNKKRRRVITAETVYGWMVSYGIPFECEKWHLNQLMALIEVCSRQNAPKQKQNKDAIGLQWAAINRARRAKTGSRG